MICEMCGKDTVTRPAFVEGTRLNVCQNCARFADDKASGRTTPAPTASVIEERLQRRERRMQTKDVYATMSSVELIDDYGGAIRNARTRKGMDQDEFAASIGEKKGIIAKLETNDIIPDEKLTRKLEKALGIKLTEVVSSGAEISGRGGDTKMTLENFIKKK
jgi:TIGR00270 family protein